MNLQAVEEQTKVLADMGIMVLQIHRFGNGEVEHVSRLAKWADFPPNAKIIDMGSGTGEVARIINSYRKDVSFCLVNLSPYQLSFSPEFKQHCCDFRNVAEEDKTFDAAMFCFSIGHSNKIESLREVYRLLKPGGILFIYDMIGYTNTAMLSLEYEVNGREVIEQCAKDADFILDFYMEPQDNGNFGRHLLGDHFKTIYGDTKAAIWRFIKNDNK